MWRAFYFWTLLSATLIFILLSYEGSEEERLGSDTFPQSAPSVLLTLV